MLVQLPLNWFRLVPLDIKWTINFPTVSFREGSLIFVVLKGVSNSSALAFRLGKLNTCFWHWPRTSLFFYVLVLVTVEQECSSLIPFSLCSFATGEEGLCSNKVISIRDIFQSNQWNKTKCA